MVSYKPFVLFNLDASGFVYVPSHLRTGENYWYISLISNTKFQVNISVNLRVRIIHRPLIRGNVDLYSLCRSQISLCNY